MMNSKQASEVVVGDMLTPVELWNKTERPVNHLENPTKVLNVSKGISQTGFLLTVKNKSGHTHQIDAGWFKPKGNN